ncbi:tRNA epoxyqueuosine(34) reductase QueG [Luteibaculum oceani]|uniref:Epoxyqueuosine reductase n=1 Tax=Luteibaculum oceani TaxID=1294296 RepID=A0A5C6VIV4_9FLAO|nr:tRNA epoxyqueuosine(34) reductase QueG [Luteibaculum oceani]TXC85067.1 tRNA epoxyqueuosine(34) reductase QueG [Luteibaculum oceani]
MDLLKSTRTQTVKQIAADLGFDFCGISKAEQLQEEAKGLELWLKKGFHGDMSYMERNFDKRIDPRILVPGAKSVISLLLNYYPSEKQREDSKYKISKYAYGRDYHKVIKKKLKHFLHAITEQIGEVGGRIFVDSAPVMDKAWAKKSGLGWIGKNTNLINKGSGSFFFIAELILDLDLEPDGPIKDYCGTCTKCIDACPTDALIQPYQIDGSKCISYLTIELKENIPNNFKGKMDDWAFGCDVCQDVCPWNRFSTPHKTEDLRANKERIQISDRGWEEMTEELFEELFKGSAIKRTQYRGIKRNIGFLKNS